MIITTSDCNKMRNLVCLQIHAGAKRQCNVPRLPSFHSLSHPGWGSGQMMSKRIKKKKKRISQTYCLNPRQEVNALPTAGTSAGRSPRNGGKAKIVFSTKARSRGKASQAHGGECLISSTSPCVRALAQLFGIVLKRCSTQVWVYVCGSVPVLAILPESKQNSKFLCG